MAMVVLGVVGGMVEREWKNDSEVVAINLGFNEHNGHK